MRSQAGEIVGSEGRISVRLLGRELGLGAADLADVVDELVLVQGRAKREGDVLVSVVSTQASALALVVSAQPRNPRTWFFSSTTKQ